MNSVSDQLEELYRIRYVSFRNGMAAITGSHESARDVVQEAFARALRDRDQYRGDGPLVGWVWRIAVRVALESRQLGFPSTLELLGTRQGIRFYAAQKPLGYCLAVVESPTPPGSQWAASDAGCANGSDAFPTARNPVFVFPVGHRFAGFAADGVASVMLVDGSGRTLASAKVSQNLFVGGAMPTGPVTVEALDAHGDVLARFESRRAAPAASPPQGG